MKENKHNHLNKKKRISNKNVTIGIQGMIAGSYVLFYQAAIDLKQVFEQLSRIIIISFGCNSSNYNDDTIYTAGSA